MAASELDAIRAAIVNGSFIVGVAMFVYAFFLNRRLAETKWRD